MFINKLSKIIHTRAFKAVLVLLILVAASFISVVLYKKYKNKTVTTDLVELLKQRDESLSRGDFYHAYLAARQAALLKPDDVYMQREAGARALDAGKKSQAHEFFKKAWNMGVRDSNTLIMLVSTSILPAKDKREYLFTLISQLKDKKVADELRAFANFRYKRYDKAQEQFAGIYNELGEPFAAEYNARCLLALRKADLAREFLLQANDKGHLDSGGFVILLNLLTAECRGGLADKIYNDLYGTGLVPDKVRLEYGYSLFNRRQYIEALAVLSSMATPVRFSTTDITNPREVLTLILANRDKLSIILSGKLAAIANIENPTDHDYARLTLWMSAALNDYVFSKDLTKAVSQKRLAEIMKIFPHGLKAPELSLTSHKARVTMAAIYSFEKKYAGVEQLKKYAQGKTRWIEGEKMLYNYLLAKDRASSEAQKNIDQAGLLLDDDPVVEIILGDDLLLKDEYSMAIESYTKALSINETFSVNPHLMENMADALGGEKRYSLGVKLISLLHSRNYLSKRSFELMRDLALAAGMPKVSVDADKLLLSKYPKDAEVLFSHGKLLLVFGKAGEALTVFKGLEGVAEPELLRKIEFQEAVSLLKLKKYKEVVEYVEGKPALQGLCAIALNEIGESGKALTVFKKVDAQGGMLKGWRLYYSGILARAGQKDEALEQLLKVKKEDPDGMEVNLEIAALLLEKGDLVAARNYAMHASEKNPDSVKPMLVIAATNVAFGKFSEARNICENVLKREPDNLEANYLMSVSLLNLGVVEDADNHIDVCLKINPVNAAYVKQKLEILCARKRYDEALKLAEKNRQIFSDKAAYERFVVEINILSGNYQKAIELLSRSEIDPVDKKLITSLALFKAGKIQQAIGQLDSGDDPRVVFRWAELNINEGSSDQVVPRLKGAKLSPSSLLLLGTIAEKRKNYRLANAIYSVALERSPDDAVLLNNFAWSGYMAGSDNWKNAYAAAARAAELMPTSPEVLLTLAKISNAMKKYDQTVTVLRRESRILLYNGELLYYLARAYEGLNDINESNRYFRLALDRLENNEILKKEIEKRLKVIE